MRLFFSQIISSPFFFFISIRSIYIFFTLRSVNQMFSFHRMMIYTFVCIVKCRYLCCWAMTIRNVFATFLCTFQTKQTTTILCIPLYTLCNCSKLNAINWRCSWFWIDMEIDRELFVRVTRRIVNVNAFRLLDKHKRSFWFCWWLWWCCCYNIQQKQEKYQQRLKVMYTFCALLSPCLHGKMMEKKFSKAEKRHSKWQMQWQNGIEKKKTVEMLFVEFMNALHRNGLLFPQPIWMMVKEINWRKKHTHSLLSPSLPFGCVWTKEE